MNQNVNKRKKISSKALSMLLMGCMIAASVSIVNGSVGQQAQATSNIEVQEGNIVQSDAQEQLDLDLNIGGNVAIAEENPTIVSSWKKLQKAINNSVVSYIQLSCDITAGWNGEAILIDEGRSVTIDLNGHKLDRGLTGNSSDLYSFTSNAKDKGNVITVNNQSTLRIEDSSDNKTGLITGGCNIGQGGGILVDNGSALLMSGGTIGRNIAYCKNFSCSENGCTRAQGGGVCLLRDSTLQMANRAKIRSNLAFHKISKYFKGRCGLADGGGIFCSDSKVFMVDGSEISDNIVHCDYEKSLRGDSYIISEGGGICIVSSKGNSASLVMKEESRIEANKAVADGASGIFTRGGGIYACSDPEIYRQPAYIDAYGVNIDVEESVICDNIIDSCWNGSDYEPVSRRFEGGGIFCCYAHVNLDHSLVTFNQASLSQVNDGSPLTKDNGGGGIYVVLCSTLNVNDTKISNNKSKLKGGGIYICNTSHAEIDDNSQFEENESLLGDNDIYHEEM